MEGQVVGANQGYTQYGGQTYGGQAYGQTTYQTSAYQGSHLGLSGAHRVVAEEIPVESRI